TKPIWLTAPPRSGSPPGARGSMLVWAVGAGPPSHGPILVCGALGQGQPVRARVGFRLPQRPSVRRRPLTPDPSHQRPDRNLALELGRVTEAAALAAARLVGKGDKEAADQAAVDGMRYALQSVQMDGLVVIGEGEKDEAPMLYNGEHI